MTITAKWLIMQIGAIVRAANDGDDERAHGLEDELAWGLIEAIANAEPDESRLLRSFARDAMTVRELDFHRWCA